MPMYDCPHCGKPNKSYDGEQVCPTCALRLRQQLNRYLKQSGTRNARRPARA